MHAVRYSLWIQLHAQPNSPGFRWSLVLIDPCNEEHDLRGESSTQSHVSRRPAFPPRLPNITSAYNHRIFDTFIQNDPRGLSSSLTSLDVFSPSIKTCVALIRVGTVSHDDLALFATILHNAHVTPHTQAGRVLEALRQLRDIGLVDISRVDDEFEWNVFQQGVIGAAVRANALAITSAVYTVDFRHPLEGPPRLRETSLPDVEQFVVGN